MTTYRHAVAADLPEMLELGLQLLATAYGEHCRPSRDALTGVFNHVFGDPLSAMYVAERDGAMVGAFVLWVYPHPMTGERTGTEVMWWSNPVARGCGLKLYHLAKRWAREHQVQVLQMMSPSAETDRLYERLGLTAIERTFQERLA